MSNQYFQFKQFRIEQGNTAMKVSTDACIQGAWTPVLPFIKHVLDIGCGTGLLSLMLAQRNADIEMDAVEIDEQAYQQAKENIFHSPWKNRVHLFQADARNFSYTKKYELIICNPPFFNNSLLGNNAERNIARHSLSLTQEELLEIIVANLSEQGYASVMLPLAEHETWNSIARQKGFKLQRRLVIRDTKQNKVTRVIARYSKNESSLIDEELIIHEPHRTKYSGKFIELMKPFYLYL